MSTWPNTGTVAVTNGSPTVTGTGTNWNTTAKVGEGFVVNGAWPIYEIVNVVSDTELTLADSFLGSTASGLAYQVLPFQGIYQAAHDALSTAIATFQGHINGPLAGLFGDGDAATPGIGFASDPDTGLARLVSNAFSAIAGGVEQLRLAGGVASGAAVQTGPADQAAGRLALAQHVFARGNILGAVSQSGGVPTGAVIDRDTNANGEFVKFADGTLICSKSGRTFTEEASGARLGGGSWTYPAAFVTGSVPSVNIGYGNGIGSDWVGTNTYARVSAFGCGAGVTAATTMRIFAIDGTPFSTGASCENVRLTAIGRWF